MKRLVVCCDGTWNTVEDNTNVSRLHAMVRDEDDAGIKQFAWYDTGVGTDTFDHVRGGVFGKGLSQNICEAYQWLMSRFDGEDHKDPDADEIYIFGFSRGAYTARSLAGLIATCGLLRPGAPLGLAQLFKRYEDGEKSIGTLRHEARKGIEPSTQQDKWLLAYSRRVKIKMVGVWDTVGTLGVPTGWFSFNGFSRDYFKFHNTKLSNLVDHAYHALAIDENRNDFDPTLWTRFITADGSQMEGWKTNDPSTEQRWFVGAHSNVGGGYDGDMLVQRPFQWMVDRASVAGLALRGGVTLTGDEHMGTVRDSFGEMAWGLYRLIKFGKRHWRTVARGPRSVTSGIDGKPGTSVTLNETLDSGVIDRWKDDSSYRPQCLLDWEQRTGKKIAELVPDDSGAAPLQEPEANSDPNVKE